MIDAKWPFRWKSDELGRIRKTKSRLVARGFKQREGIYFGESLAPTDLSPSVRLLRAIACELDLDMSHFDVEEAFIQPKDDDFLRLRKGCSSLFGEIVWLNKSLYGSKQVSRPWHAHLTSCLKMLGFQ